MCIYVFQTLTARNMRHWACVSLVTRQPRRTTPIQIPPLHSVNRKSAVAKKKKKKVPFSYCFRLFSQPVKIKALMQIFPVFYKSFSICFEFFVTFCIVFLCEFQWIVECIFSSILNFFVVFFFGVVCAKFEYKRKTEQPTDKKIRLILL